MEHLKGEEENISHAPKHGSLYSKGEKDDYDSPHLGGLGGINASAFWGSVTGRSSDQTNFRSTFTHPSHSSKNLRGSPTCSQNSELPSETLTARMLKVPVLIIKTAIDVSLQLLIFCTKKIITFLFLNRITQTPTARLIFFLSK